MIAQTTHKSPKVRAFVRVFGATWQPSSVADINDEAAASTVSFAILLSIREREPTWATIMSDTNIYGGGADAINDQKRMR